MRSGEHIAADGSVERWNPALARWENVARTGATPTAAQAARQQPLRAVKPQRALRMYQGARPTRTTAGFGSSGSSSADAELATSLTQLRARSRQMLRDSPYAKRAREIVVNNVVGSGIGVQAQVSSTRDSLRTNLNTSIEQAWADWCEPANCHTGGALHFYDFERALLGEVFEAGEVFVRIHRRPFGESKVPIALELIESERLPDGIADPGATSPDAEIRMGIEVDRRFKRPIAYWIRDTHPGDIRGGVAGAERYERVPADQIIHLRIVKRWPQTRGEPWLHTVLVRLNDMNEYSALEVQAARASASLFATIQTPEEASPVPNDEEEGDAKPVMDMEPLTIQELAPGEKLEMHNPGRPNQALDPFMRYMSREVAAGIPGVRYASMTGDYAQANYSSERVGMLDERDTWKTLQQWWVRSFRKRLHREWMAQAVPARAIAGLDVQAWASDMARYLAAKFKCRGWNWVDPTTEVEAYERAVKARFISTTQVIDQTANGQDIEDVIAEIKRENELFAAAGIRRSTEVPEPVAEPAQPAAAPGAEPPKQDETQDDAERRRVVNLVRH